MADPSLTVPLSTSFRQMVHRMHGPKTSGGVSDLHQVPENARVPSAVQQQGLQLYGGGALRKTPKASCSTTVVVMAVTIGILTCLLFAIIIFSVMRKNGVDDKKTKNVDEKNTENMDGIQRRRQQLAAKITDPVVRAYYNHSIRDGKSHEDALIFAHDMAQHYAEESRHAALLARQQAIQQEEAEERRIAEAQQEEEAVRNSHRPHANEPTSHDLPPQSMRPSRTPPRGGHKEELMVDSLQAMLGDSMNSLPSSKPPNGMAGVGPTSDDGGEAPHTTYNTQETQPTQEAPSEDSFVDFDDI